MESGYGYIETFSCKFLIAYLAINSSSNKVITVSFPA